MADLIPKDAAMKTRHTDPYRGLRIILTTSALALPILVLVACGVYLATAQ